MSNCELLMYGSNKEAVEVPLYIHVYLLYRIHCNMFLGLYNYRM